MTGKMTCKLCGKPGQLKNSHIIPEFVYRSLYDEKHRFRSFTAQEEDRNRHLQMGIREHLLCGDCETLLSKNERYVSLVFSGNLRVRISSNSNFIKVEGLDYLKFKLFALSVLWRAGVAKNKTFEEVKLGTHEKHLRKMLMTNDPGRPETYPFFLAPIMHEKKQLMDLIVSPTRAHFSGHYAYRFVFAGLLWVFTVSSHEIPKDLQGAVLSAEGNLLMFSQDFFSIRFLTVMAADIAKKGKCK